MAIVESGVTSNGTHYVIRDDLYANESREEIDRRIDNFYKTASRIARRAAERMAAAKANEQDRG